MIEFTRHRPDTGYEGAESLELLTDDEEVWTITPAEATGDRRMAEWISVDDETLRDLAEWR